MLTFRVLDCSNLRKAETIDSGFVFKLTENGSKGAMPLC